MSIGRSLRRRKGEEHEKKINWTKGLTRIYLLLVFVWVLYLIFWIPSEHVKTWQALALYENDKTKQSEYLERANLIAQWKELGKEFTRTPIAGSALLLLPPILGYGFLRLIIFITKWIFMGFKYEN
jgi:hypothetical protein